MSENCPACAGEMDNHSQFCPLANSQAESSFAEPRWLAAISRQLDDRVKDMKEEFLKCETPSQKNALGTAIITVNAIAWALKDARKQMAANDQAEAGGGRER